MILCDIGNSYYHFYENGHLYKFPVSSVPQIPAARVAANDDEPSRKRIYYISVNDRAEAALTEVYEAINICSLLNLDSGYIGLGTDRAFACYAIAQGVVVDAGSAITVDVVSSGVHLGGFIMPGLSALLKCMAGISPRLGAQPNLNVEIAALPQHTVDAISYGVIAPIVNIIKEVSRNLPLFFTGGDGAYFARFFDNGIVDNSIVFKGMLKVINENGLAKNG